MEDPPEGSSQEEAPGMTCSSPGGPDLVCGGASNSDASYWTGVFGNVR